MTLLSSRHTVNLLFLLAIALRVTVLAMYPMGSALFSDMENYQNIADQVLAGVWKPSHFQQAVGFALIVAAAKRLFTNWIQALALYHLVLSTATVAIVWNAATRAFGQRVGVLSLLLAAIHVPWLVLDTVALSETTFTFLMAVLLWASLEIVERPTARWSTLWGLVFIAAFWVKGTHAFLGPMFLLGVLAWRRWSREAIVTMAVPLCTVVAAGLLVHGVLSYETTGTFRLSAAAGGLNFVEGKCPSKRNIDPTGMNWLSPVYQQLGVTTSKLWDRPFTDSGYYMREGLKCIARDPLVLVQSFESVAFLFVGNLLWPATHLTIAPLARLYELFTGPFLMGGTALWLLARWPWRRDRWGELIVWAAPLAALCLCVYVFKSEIRFRVPFDVWLIPMAVDGWLAVATAVQARRS
jgi:hypothetical protein